MQHISAARAIVAALALVSSALALAAAAQPSGRSPLSPPPNGPRRADPTAHAFTNATVHTRPGETLAGATVLIRDGRIEAVVAGDNAKSLKTDGYRLWDCTDLHIYPGFIDPYVEVEAPLPDMNAPGVHWNAKVTPQRSALDGNAPDTAAAESLRKLGFTAAAIAPSGGIFRGTSAVVSLAKRPDDTSMDRPPVYRDRAYHTVALETGRRGGAAGAESRAWSGYPGSEMGVIALIRQTFIDADWQPEARAAAALRNDIALYHEHRKQSAVEGGGSAILNAIVVPQGLLIEEPPANCLDTLTDIDAPFVFVVDDELQSLRAAKIAREFERDAVILGSGNEYKRLEAIKADGLTHIIPLNYPRAPDVSTIGKAEAVDLAELMAWEQAPTNPRRLDAAGVTIALTTAKLRDRSQFTENLEKAIKHGLAPERAFEMVTTVPAELLGVADQLGTIEPGKVANLVVADGELFKKPEEKKEEPKKDEKPEGEPAVDEDKPAPEKPGENPEGGDPAEPQPERQPGDEPGQEAKPDQADKDADGEGAKKKDKKAKIRDVWVDGVRHEINAAPGLDITGTWTVTLEPAIPDAISYVIEEGNKITIKSGDKTASTKGVRLEENQLSFTFEHEPFGEPGVFHIAAVIEGEDESMTMHGQGVRADGQRFLWSAKRTPDALSPAPGRGGGGDVAKGDRGGSGRRGDSPALGNWRITETDGEPCDPNAPGIFVEIAADAVKITFDRGSHSVVIPATDVKLEGKSVSFTHALEPLGMEGQSKDTATVEGDTLTGESTFADGTKHTYKATRVQAEARGRGRRGPGAVDEPRPLRGSFVLTTIDGEAKEAAETGTITIKPDGSVSVTGEGKTVEAQDVKIEGDHLTFTLDMSAIGAAGLVKAEAKREGDRLTGTMTLPDGRVRTFEATPTQETAAKPAAEDKVPETYGYPFGAYGVEELPKQEKLLITNATIWTSGPQGVIENGALVISEGKIAYVGPSASIPRLTDEFRTIDAQGKHITPGLIDCHSHTGISGGVNEGGQAITAEVRIADVTDPDSINWYRQLAGGVTAVNSLHGSANAIGGQNQVNKIRWGVPHPDMMHLEGAKPGIKFALGENPRGANGRGGDRYPQTRMGVETLIRDRFTAAREYAGAMSGDLKPVVNDLGDSEPQWTVPQRRDLELEALAEILAGERLVHCHSYRQDEILALCRIAEEFGFKIGTFQHVLEGYKVADEIAKVALGASCFTDWWAYKVEVQDAIPQNGPIMHEQGVVVSFNSDSDELARRMNWEAAKAVKYGDLSEEEALKFVTINPAIQLAVQDRVGSLEVGKDADFAVWSGPPLSSLTRCEATYVDGREYFSLEQDKQHRERIAAERSRLIQKVLAEGTSRDREGAGSGSGGAPGPGRFRRPTEEDYEDRSGSLREYYLDLINRGIDPEAARPGECGCGLEHWR